MSKASSLKASWRRAGSLHVEASLEELGVRHGVTTKALGDMKDPSARTRALAEAGLSGHALVLSQVHGTGIVETASVAGIPEPRPKGDGWITAEPGVVPSVYAADCLPIFVWDLQLAAAGVFHAGWRGLAAGMPRAAVRAFRRFAIGPERLAAAVGPHVGACCYQVGPEVAEKFRREVLAEGRLDLGAEARLQLEESGIPASRISVSPACTACSAGEFFSYRREKLDHRLMAFISLPERAHVS